ncbi:LCP family protein [Protaetiibacter intestinalis]|uniref:LCP family protein n=1 Tax=Protaetiibacter intestinalis TaxID=2419774 RepID=UPI0026B6CA52|nr:LCP family protein [Protaetiibacter intestinalis]
MTSVLRDPDRTAEGFMTKRAWWLIALNLLVPGSAQVLAGNRRLGRFGLAATLVAWVLALVLLLLGLLAREWLLALFTNTVVLGIAVAVLVFYAVLWLVLTLDTLRLVRLVSVAPVARGFVGGLATIALVATAGTAGYAAVSTTSAIGLLDAVFADGSVEPPVDGRYNILLLGGDAGPDRVGLRPDSISVASVDAETGAVVLIGIPRNLYRAPFSAGSPMLEEYPDGWSCGDDCLIDYVYTYGQEHPELYPDAEEAGSSPGIEAMRDAVEGVLDLKLQYYVLIDMQGFADLIDALGGVEITVDERLPIGSNNYDDGTHAPPAGYIEAGTQRMDGQTALWYARTRYNTTDYARMARQRQVQEAILAQANPANVLANFTAIAQAGAQVVKTDIPAPMLSHFVTLAEKSKTQPVVSQDFVPPDWDNLHPDFAAIQAKVQELLHPTSADPTG